MTSPTDAADAGASSPPPASDSSDGAGAGGPAPRGRATSEREGFRDWPAPFRWVVYAVVVVLVLGLAGAGGAWWVARRSLPQTDGSLRIAALDTTSVVRRDAQGVPQIYAETSRDLFTAQGFVQAQDRFWQMDYARHAASGQLAEIFGGRALARDELARTLGWRRTAQRELGLLDAQTREALDAYSDGVNAYLDMHLGSDNSLEYTVVSLDNDYRPADWTAVDSLAYLKQVAWQQSGNLNEEVDRATLAASPPPRDGASLYPAYPLGTRAPITGGAVPGAGLRSQPPDSLAEARTTRTSDGLLGELGDDIAAEDPLTSPRPGAEGTAWAVSGRLTTTGEPLLAGVPGQQVGLPGAAYQVGLHCTTLSADCPYDVSGTAYAAFPGVASGHNGDLAWALTGLDADTVDLYLEDVSGSTSLHAGRREPLTRRTERIRVAGGTTREITVRSTRHGPLVSDVSDSLAELGRAAPVPSGSPDRGEGYAVAVHWEASTPRPSADAVLALDRARDADDVRAAARSLSAPATGIVWAADGRNRGSIGYQATGAIPARSGSRGLTPQPGWSASSDPDGVLVPFGDLPHQRDPSSGMVVAAGQPPSGDVTTLGDSFDYGYRADRITGLLRVRSTGERRLRVADLTAIAADTRSATAPALVPYLLDVRLPSRYDRQGQRVLAGWDYTQSAGSGAAAYYNVVWRNVLALTFHDQLPPRLWPAGESRWAQVVDNLLSRPDDPWWDDAATDDRVEDRDDILAQAMSAARNEMTRLQARDPQRWSWGRLHRLDLDRPDLSQQRLGRWLFDRDGYAAPGGPGAVAQTAYDPRQGYSVTAAPAARLVSDLADPDRSRWVVLAGTSGHAFGPHYTDQVRTWLAGSSYPWPSSARAVRSASDDTLVLRP